MSAEHAVVITRTREVIWSDAATCRLGAKEDRERILGETQARQRYRAIPTCETRDVSCRRINLFNKIVI